jgi:hypothetical protein
MNDRPRSSDGGIIAGVMLIAIGALFLLEQFHVAMFTDVAHDWWPMILVLIGLVRLMRGRRPWSGVWLIALGSWLEAVQLHLYGLTYHNSWPLLLIFVGLSMTLRAFADTFRRRAS